MLDTAHTSGYLIIIFQMLKNLEAPIGNTPSLLYASSKALRHVNDIHRHRASKSKPALPSLMAIVDRDYVGLM